MQIPGMRGVPRGLVLDGWWLSEAAVADKEPTWAAARAGRGVKGWRAAGLLLALVALADWLFWGHWPGLSLAVFAVALVVAMLLQAGLMPGQRRWVAVIGLLLCLLPVIEQVQALSVLFWIAGLGLAAGVVAGGQGPAGVAAVALRFLAAALPQIARDLEHVRRVAMFGTDWIGCGERALRVWALPLAAGGTFILLLLAANPLLQHWLHRLTLLHWPVPGAERMLAWGVVAGAVWPFLVIAAMRVRVLRPLHPVRLPMPGAGLVNAQSITVSLILFNAILAVRSGLDGLYLWGGAVLPEGVGHAEYAHRGAYPLVATALLAGLFVLISARYAQGWMLRALLALWLVQNLALVIAAIYRLDLYVGAFGLTRFRLAAFVWMGLVAFGLVLTGWQVWRQRSLWWLAQGNAAALAFCLYSACFVDFAGVIARTNLNTSGRGDAVQRVDSAYICGLGPGAVPAILEFQLRTGIRLCATDGIAVPPVGNWREWGFRNWRIARYLAVPGAEDQAYPWQRRAY